jgi:transposase InsO family protein
MGGRRPVSKEVRALIFRMAAENPTWGGPRIHGELLMLGFDLSEPTVSRWLRRAPRAPDPAKRWLTFLRNHREAIAAMDFFTVPTLTFGILYCFFIIGHDRRRILHHHVTRNPTALWVALQLRETWEYSQEPQRFLIFDRDSKFSADVVSTVKAIGSQPVRTAFRSPWQNGIAERWVGSVRRDLLDHVIVLNERHLRRLLKDYVRYYHEDRTHLGLEKDTPGGRVAASLRSHTLVTDNQSGILPESDEDEDTLMEFSPWRPLRAVLLSRGAWRCGKRSAFPTSPHPRRRLRTNFKRGATLTIYLVQKIGQVKGAEQGVSPGHSISREWSGFARGRRFRRR